MKKYLSLIAGVILVVFVIQVRKLVIKDIDQAAAAPNLTVLSGTIERISVHSSGEEGRDASDHPSISDDGCLIAFSSNANNLVDDDTNGKLDVFVHDRCAGTTERISLTSGGQQANGSSWEPSISADGRYVAFSSSASNLVAGDSNGVTDVFVRDRLAGTTTRISLHSGGQQGNDLSLHPEISADGQVVAFISEATNLVSNDTNGVKDVFVHVRATSATSRVSVSSTGQQANGPSDNAAISGDGRYVAFESIANNLVANDLNNTVDVFVRDRQAAATERVSLGSINQEGNNESYDAAISADGRYVAFESWATNLVANDTNNRKDVFVRDRHTGTTERASIGDETIGPDPGAQANGDSGDAAIAVVSDCYLVTFESWAGNLDPRFGAPENLGPPNYDRDSDIFVRNQCAGTTERVTLHPDSEFGREDSVNPSISANGQFVAFKSRTQDLVTGDTNGEADVFVWDGSSP